MTSIAAALWLTTLVFHGAHCLGYKQWADKHFMKYDSAAVASLVLVPLF